MNRIGLFGGTFDPPHDGHVHIARAFADMLKLDSVVFIPAGDPYHKVKVSRTSARQRLAMVELATAADLRFAASDCDLVRHGATHSLDTVSLFRQVFPQVQLWWLMGMDSLLTLPDWYRYEAFLKAVNLAVAVRAEASLSQLPVSLQSWLSAALGKAEAQPDGTDGGRLRLLQAAAMNISSSAIRAQWAAGCVDQVRAEVPAAVFDYIDCHRLYRA